MTRNSEKLRSLCLATLMVLAVVAGTVALSGSAAAASNPTVVSLTNAADDNGNGVPDVDSNTTVQHTLTYTVDNVSADGSNDTLSVTIPAGSYESLDNLTVTNRTSGAEIPVTSSPEVTNDGRTVSFDISPESDADSVDIQVEVQFTANWPAVSETVSGPVNASVTDSAGSDIDNSTLATVEILGDGAPAPAPAPADTTVLDSGETFYTGQEVTVTGLTADADYRVREVDDGEPDTLRQTLTADSDGAVEFELADSLSDGEFVITDGDGDVIPIDEGTAGSPQSPTSTSTTAAAFDVVAMDLTAEFDEASVTNDGDSSTVEYEVESDVRNSYAVNVSAQGDLDVDDLEDIFGDEATVVESFEDDDTIQITRNDSTTAEGTYELDFDDIDAGSYTFETNVSDADASDSDDIDVLEVGSASADFGERVYTDQRGDVVNITVEMDNTDEATVQVGDVDESGYAITAEVIDDDEDGVAYVEFNSFTAGSESATVLAGGDEDTDISDVRTAPDSYDGNDPLGSDLLDTTDDGYRLYVAEETVSGTLDSGDADARGTLDLEDPAVEDIQTWTAPEESLSDLRGEDAEDLPAYAEAGNLTRTDTVAEGDAVVVQVSASGLEGALQDGDATELYGATSEAGELFNLSFEGDSAPNTDDGDVNIADLDTDNYSVIYDGANDAHYVVIDSAALTDQFEHEDGDEYTANFSVFEDNSDLVDDDVSVTQDFTVEDPEIELDTDENDEILAPASAGAEITGDTNLAPGTEVEVAIESENSSDPFLERPEATVQSNGTFAAVVDFSENQPGTEFTAQAIVDDVESDEYDGQITESQAPETPGTGPETPGEATGTPEVATEESTPELDSGQAAQVGTETAADGSPTTTTSGGSGPGFTAALALIALVAVALLAVRRHS